MKFKLVLVICIAFGDVFCQTQHCGKKFDAVGLGFGFEKVQSNNAWPWLVAFIYWYEQFFCGGNLVSSKHVISAAHCFHPKLQVTVQPPQYITALVGKHNLSVANEPGSTEHSVWEIIIHPDWDSQAERFDADISVVVLRYPVDLSGNVKPICLPHQSDFRVVGTGTVVGWGKSEHSEAVGEEFDSTPNQLEIPSESQENCFLTLPKLDYSSSNRTFCAGFVNKSKAPCTGDSGGGFYQRDLSTRLFKLKGIVSASLNVFPRGCNIEAYSLYTNVAKFADWILEKIEETKEIVFKKIEFTCSPYQRGEFCVCSHNYSGPITRNIIANPDWSTFRTSLKFSRSTHIFLSNRETFATLVQLKIVDQPIKFIERENFASMKALERLELSSNKIEFLPENVFWDLTNVEYIVD